MLERLKELGATVDPTEFDVLCLPENIFEVDDVTKAVESDEHITLGKLLKEAGLNAANSYDLGLESRVIERRSNTIWLGVIWIGEKLAVPVLVEQLKKYLPSRDDGSERNVVKCELYRQRGEDVDHLKFDGDSECFKKLLDVFGEGSEVDKIGQEGKVD